MNEDIPVLELGSYSWIDRNGNEYATDAEYYELLEEDDITHE